MNEKRVRGSVRGLAALLILAVLGGLAAVAVGRDLYGDANADAAATTSGAAR